MQAVLFQQSFENNRSSTYVRLFKIFSP